MRKEVIAVFDIGRTNKKFTLYDERLEPVYRISTHLPETVDNDLYPCEDILLLKDWMFSVFAEMILSPKYLIRALNFSAYGASLVHLDHENQPIAPIYNYLKPYDKEIQESLYNKYGGKSSFCEKTASPSLGHLNSGLTLYWLKQRQPEIFKHINTSLHLPEYCSFLFSNHLHSGITSIGCHTHLWDYSTSDYHEWVMKEGLISKLAPLYSSEHFIKTIFNGLSLSVGMGLHDSSAALIPHLKRQNEPFVLLSTGTWCISLNPFDNEMLSEEELLSDCLYYMSYLGKPVKAARFFAGKTHEDMVNGLCRVYDKETAYFYELEFDEGLGLMAEEAYDLNDSITYYNLPSAAQAYHHFMYSLVKHLLPSINMAKGESKITRLIVEGGFSRNKIFMTLLRRFFSNISIETSGDDEASALGAALIMKSVFTNSTIVSV